MDDFLGWAWNTNAVVTVLVGLVLLGALFGLLRGGASFARDLGGAWAKGWREVRPKRD